MDVGTPVTHYRLLRPLGRGGMGEVYLAEDALLGRQVALKFVRSDDPDPSARKRLLHEAKAAASLDHPFICHVFEVGESNGQPFIAMEFLEGRTLEQCLATGPMPAADAVRIAGEIAEALDAAHRRGVVHRDLKPSNVMVTVDGHVKVMDFGIARRFMFEPSAVTQSATFTDDQVVGTLLYMSPEQVLGNPATPASDQFALGLVLSELLTVQHPFHRPTAIATATAIAHDAPAPIDGLGPPTDDINRVVQRLLAKNSMDRYSSAGEAVAELRNLSRLLSGVPESGSRRPRAGRRTAVLLSTLMLALAAGVVGWLLLLRPGPALAFQERDWIVIADLENKAAETGFDTAIQSALTVALRQSRYVNVLPRPRVAEAIRLTGRKDPGPLDEALASEVALREGARAVLACSLASSGEGYTIDARLVDPRTHQAVAAGTVRAADKAGILPALDGLASRVRQRLGESLDSISQENRALPMATTGSLEALKLWVDGRNLANRDEAAGYNLISEAVRIDPDFALAHADLALNAYLHGDPPTGEKHFERALGLIDRLTLRERLWIQAVSQDSRGHREEAAAAYRTYLSRYPDDADAWFRLGWTQMATLNRYQEAVNAFNNVLRINPSSAPAYSNLATCYRLLNNLPESLRYYAKTFDLRPAMLTSGFLNHEYGFTLVAVGRADEARRVFEKMAAEPESGKQASGIRSIALLDMYQGRYRAAIERLDSAILLNRASNNALGELRNHLYAAWAARTRGDRQRFRAELARADRLIGTHQFEPWMVSIAGRYFALDGQLSSARRLLEGILASIGNRTAYSAVNRSVQGDEAAVNILRGEIALAERHWQEAIPLFEVGNRLSLDAAGSEPLARAYVAGGRWSDAVRVYSALAAEPSLGGEQQEWAQLGRFELGRVYERLGDREKARGAYKQFLDRWKEPDPDLPLLAQARARLAALR